DMSNWDNEPVPQQEWVVLNRIPRRQTVLFSGEGGYGKSMVQMHMSVAHVLGRDWPSTMPELGPAIFLDAEDEVQVLHHRMAAIVEHYRTEEKKEDFRLATANGTTFAKLIKGGLHLMSFAGQEALLATTTHSGKIEPTPLYHQILEAAGDIRPVMIGL